jgi:hypothetical protein
LEPALCTLYLSLFDISYIVEMFQGLSVLRNYKTSSLVLFGCLQRNHFSVC